MNKTKTPRTNAHGRRLPRRPRWGLTGATIELVRHNASAMTAAEITLFLAPMHASFDALRAGTASGNHWRVLYSLYFFARALERTGNLAGGLDLIDEFMHAMDDVQLRSFNPEADTWARMTLRAAEMEPMRLAIELLEMQLQNCTWAEFEKSRHLAKAMCRQAGGTVTDKDAADAILADVMGAKEPPKGNA